MNLPVQWLALIPISAGIIILTTLLILMHRPLTPEQIKRQKQMTQAYRKSGIPVASKLTGTLLLGSMLAFCIFGFVMMLGKRFGWW